jgi:hypothetical protein
MNQWKVEVIALAVGGHPLSRLRVTWQSEPGWFARVFRGLERVERSAIFAGTGDVWHVLPDWRRASRTFEQHLRQFESRLIFGDAPTASNPPSLRLATTSPDPGESLARKPAPATRTTPALAHRVEPESGAAVQSSTVQVHSKAVATMHRRFRRIKLH